MSGPSCMSKQQMGDYLHDLRHHRPSRPSLNGTRSPPPSTLRSWRSSIHSDITQRSGRHDHEPASISRSSSRISSYENGESLRSGRSSPEKFDRLSMQEQREIQREKAETRRISRALDEIDLQDEEAVMAAAKAEAEELVWRYNNPNAPYRPPRDEKTNTNNQETPQSEFKKPLARRSLDLLRRLSITKDSPQIQRTPSTSSITESELKPRRSLRRLSQKLSFSNISHRRRSSNAKRNISGEVQTEPFPNGEQKIYEDPPEDVADLISAYADEEPETQPLHVRRNPFARARQSVSKSPDKHRQKSFQERVEIQRNPPSQTRNPSYMSNREPVVTVPQSTEVLVDDYENHEELKYRDGKELRSDDIRAATSMRRMDRSPRLPSPSAVTDRPDRPIVSFDPDWKPPEVDTDAKEPPYNPKSQRQLAQRQQSGNLSDPIESNTVRSSDGTSEVAKAFSKNRDSGNNSYFSRQAESSSKRMTRAQGSRKEIRAESIQQTDKVLDGEPGPAIDTSEQENDHPILSAGHQHGNQGSDIPSSVNPGGQAVNNRTTHQPRQFSPDGTVNGSKELEKSRSRSKERVEETQPIPTISCTPADDDDESATNMARQARSNNSITVPGISCTPAEEDEVVKTEGTASRRGPTQERLMSKPHWSPVVRDRAALCSQCALPIAGRIVTAAGARFHPECFTCHHCGEALECVAFYPEPAEHRTAREDRNDRRAAGEVVEQPRGTSETDDADDSLRFFCHLDYHEFFSPRCKTCKTPIEGQVIVACGAEYHPGHFFCAQCGDPFDPKTPFVEKDGYAWCINCHTNRYSAKCRKCHRPVTNMVLNALGTEWHEECFRCTECDGKFTDGRYFLRGDSKAPVCFACEERRLKA